MFEPLFQNRQTKIYPHSEERFQAIENQQDKIIEMLTALSRRLYKHEMKNVDE